MVTQSFGWLDPGLFGSFSLSMMTMVQVCVDHRVIVRILMDGCARAHVRMHTHPHIRMTHIAPVRS